MTGDYTEPATAITFTFNFSADGEYISADVSCPHESTGCGGLGPLDDLCSAASYNREDCNFGCTRSLIRPFLRMLDADLLRELQS